MTYKRENVATAPPLIGDIRKVLKFTNGHQSKNKRKNKITSAQTRQQSLRKTDESASISKVNADICSYLSLQTPEKTIEKLIKSTICFPPPAEMALLQLKNIRLTKMYIRYHRFSEEVLKDLILKNDEQTLKLYIDYRTFSLQMQIFLIQSHQAKLLRYYLSKHSLAKAAQQELVTFMEEKTMR